MSIKTKGFGLIEVVVAVAVFMIIVTGIGVGLGDGLNLNRLGLENTKADLLAREGLEAVRSIKKLDWTGLNNGSYKLSINNNQWQLAPGSENIEGKYIREIRIDDVTENGKMVADVKKIDSIVRWNFSPTRNNSINYSIELSNWEKMIVSRRGGILVYGETGAASDLMKYKTIDTNGNWSLASVLADIDTATTNRTARNIRVYSSPTRNEKIVMSRHFNGSGQYIYAQVYNGTSFGNVVLLSNWNAATFPDVNNFDGTYLANGDFVAVFSDNTTTPKFRVWNGTNWNLASVAMRNSGGIPNFIEIKARPGTNEIMAAIFDQSSDTNTQYFSGGAYNSSNWTLHSEHANAAPSNSRGTIGFDWSTSGQTGTLIFANNSNDKNVTFRVFTANLSGGGSWGAVKNATNQNSNIGTMRIEAGAEYYWSCNKNVSAQINCYRNDVSTSIGQATLITAMTASGDQRSFDISLESQGQTEGLVVYSDNSSTAKYRVYNLTGDTYQNQLNLIPGSGVVNTTRLIPCPGNDDIMVIMSNRIGDMQTAVWDGSNNMFFESGGYGFNDQNVNGLTSDSYWYDFEWDKN